MQVTTHVQTLTECIRQLGFTPLAKTLDRICHIIGCFLDDHAIRILKQYCLWVGADADIVDISIWALCGSQDCSVQTQEEDDMSNTQPFHFLSNSEHIGTDTDVVTICCHLSCDF